MRGKVKKPASKTKSVTNKKAAKSAAQSKAVKRTPAKPRAAVKSPKLKLKALRQKPPAPKAKAKQPPAVKRLPVKPQAKPLVKAINKKEQRLATLKAVGKKALERVQAAAQKADKAATKGAALVKKSTRGLTAKEKALVKEFERRELSPADAEARRVRLKNLIVLGKERTVLTYAEINDHLPDDMMDAE